MNRRYDKSRKSFDNIMKDNGIRHGTIKYEQLRHFLDDPANSPYLQLYYNLCTGYMDPSEVSERAQDLVTELEFVYGGNYSYRKLFSLDEHWYEYFKENAWPCGARKEHDRRRGVDREQVDHIMRIKSGPPPITLERAIVLQCEKRYSATLNG